ncbi:hypothetical protein [Prosthecobacter dejongeii]|uniref:Autotransporter-associated beta strand repeat-containing protein n=1 Tax=Prosthecobacter dejongeii TaxID=48465 RepID=A0A7W7YL90_9BACT|nr:hypothetical protein [Prosthecobacter dejongeii]MBB5038275.1 hypothetical protein [Prosthecobacter dejongeii]
MMKTLLHLWLGAMLCGCAMGAEETLKKNTQSDALTENFNVPTGKTITIGAGGTLVIASGATIQALEGSTLIGLGSGGGGGLSNVASTITGATLTFTGALTTGRTITWRDLAGTVALLSDLSSYQPSNSNLTSIAALTTTSFGRGFLTLADEPTARSYLQLGTAAGANTTSLEGSPSAVSLASHTHSLAGSYITGTLPTSKGGTGVSGSPTNGQLLIGVTSGGIYARSTLTGGTGITVTNGAGTITLAVDQSALSLTSIGGTLSVAKGGTGITNFGSGIATFLGTPSSSNLRSALTDKTGTGAAVFANTPALVTPDIGEATGTSLTLGSGAARLNANYVVVADAISLHSVFGVNVGNQFGIGFTADGFWFSSPDTILRRDAAGAMGLRNSSNAQAFSVYRTTDSDPTTNTNYERIAIRWSGTVGQIIPQAGGTGTARKMEYHTTADGVSLSSGFGSPESVVTAKVGSIYTRLDGGAGTTLYIKESGTGNTGWVAK